MAVTPADRATPTALVEETVSGLRCDKGPLENVSKSLHRNDFSEQPLSAANIQVPDRSRQTAGDVNSIPREGVDTVCSSVPVRGSAPGNVAGAEQADQHVLAALRKTPLLKEHR
jgi:hypothetical protein